MDLLRDMQDSLAKMPIRAKGGIGVVNLLGLFSTIYKTVDAMENGQPFEASHKFGSINLDVSLQKVDKVDDMDIVIKQTDGRKISSILIDSLLEGFAGKQFSQDVGIEVDNGKDATSYLMLNVTAGQAEKPKVIPPPIVA
jgi:hypothetical protein